MESWLNDPAAHIERWPNLPFPITRAVAPGALLMCLTTYPGWDGTDRGERGPLEIDVRERTLELALQPYTFADVALNPLVNMLGRYHDERSPIVRVEVET